MRSLDHPDGIADEVLTIGVEGDAVLGVGVAEHVVEPGLECGSLTEVHGVAYDDGPGCPRELGRAVRGSVVHAQDDVELRAEVAETAEIVAASLYAGTTTHVSSKRAPSGDMTQGYLSD